MRWTISEIKEQWLVNGAIAVAEAEVEAAFDRCEQLLGRQWMEESRGGLTGPIPTLAIVTTGQWLSSLNGLKETEELIAKVRQNDPSARAELRALHLLRTYRNADVELFPVVPVTGKPARQADLRVRYGDSQWVVVEVARPDMSEVEQRARALADEMTRFVDSIRKPFALEVFLRREPSREEATTILDRIPQICDATPPAREDLPDNIGFLLLQDAPGGMVTTNDYPGEELLPMIGTTRAKISFGSPLEPNRHIAIRMAFADARAEAFLRSESRQLPEEGSGLLMIDVHHVPGGFQSWEPLLRRRFQPGIHTRVGGVCLFADALCHTAAGAASLTQTKLLINPHAATPLPSWIVEALNAAGTDYRQHSELAKR